MPNRKVLIVDDEESSRAYVERVLDHAGYTAVTAANGYEAFHVVEQQDDFDLYVLDVVMPGMQGDELARRLRERNADAKILYFTGYVDKLFEQRTTLWENEAFIEKPVSINGLIEAVSMLLTAG